MCGIVGIAGEGISNRHLEGMLDTIRHRGPDGRRVWRNGSVALGHARLKIIDLSDAAAQPMVDEETGNVLVFNGEIYNYIELKRELKASYRFRSRSDTEVLLAAYRKWGAGCLAHLRGMFAFALWDARARRLLLARDRLGIKPLYYRREKDSLLFASEIKALLNVAGRTHTANPDRMLEFLAARHQDSDATTFFSEVHQLLPGQFAWVDRSGAVSPFQTYWSAADHFGDRVLDAGAKKQFKALLIDTVRLHLRSDVPVGSFVSGGLDSSTVACIASELAPRGTLHTYSSVLEIKNEENALIPHVQRKVGGKDHPLILDGTDFMDVLPRLIHHQDEPVADASMYAHYRLCRMARDDGVKVLLSGNGGDEVLGGYPCHIYAFLGHLLRRCRLPQLGRVIGEFARNRSESRRLLWLRAFQEAAPFALRTALKRRQAGACLQHTLLRDRVSRYRPYYQRDADPWRSNYLNCIFHWTVPPFLHYEDRNSMAFGVEVRVPLLDHRVVEFAAGLAPEYLVGGRSKHVIRELMDGIVPREVLGQRCKEGFAAPLPLFLKRNRESIRSVLGDTLRDVPFLDYRKSLRLCEDFLSGGATDTNLFWRTFSLAMWHKVFF